MEIKRDGRTNPGAQVRRGNEIGCAVRPRGGLFDIVKNDWGQAGARTVPWAAFATLRAGAQPVTWQRRRECPPRTLYSPAPIFGNYRW